MSWRSATGWLRCIAFPSWVGSPTGVPLLPRGAAAAPDTPRPVAILVDELREYPHTRLPFRHWCHLVSDHSFTQVLCREFNMAVLPFLEAHTPEAERR